jgi:lipoprotein-releasing system permease protein
VTPQRLIALRYLRAKHSYGFISFIGYLGMVGLAIGVAALILTLSVMRGFEDEVENKVASMDGHLRLATALGDDAPLPDSLIASILAHAEVEWVIPFTARHALVRKGSQSDGVFLMGANLEQLRNTVHIDDFLTAGTYPSIDDSSSIILGEKLARQLHVAPGGEVVLFDVGYLLEEQGIRGRKFTRDG